MAYTANMHYDGKGHKSGQRVIGLPVFFIHALPAGNFAQKTSRGGLHTRIQGTEKNEKHLPTCVPLRTKPPTLPKLHRRVFISAQLTPADGSDRDMMPRFRRDDDNSATQTSFFDDPNTDDQLVAADDDSRLRGNALTPNTRLLRQVRGTMERLGVDPNRSTDVSPLPREPTDFSKINPLSAFAGSAGAAVISAIAWRLLNDMVLFVAHHSLDDQIYIIQRVAVVVRTTLVCLLALGSGISGVTSLGLLLLALRTSYAVVTREYATKNGHEKDSK